MTSEFVGVDGCRCGWVSVGFNNDGKYELKAFFTFDELVEYYNAAKLILVDMPIGLPEGAPVCGRQAQRYRRRKIGRRPGRKWRNTQGAICGGYGHGDAWPTWRRKCSGTELEGWKYRKNQDSR